MPAPTKTPSPADRTTGRGKALTARHLQHSERETSGQELLSWRGPMSGVGTRFTRALLRPPAWAVGAHLRLPLVGPRGRR